ncbi:MAG TPA: hypothetical protein VN837_01775 [Chloroflexota bacterium]|nr:hypothetical protein [Chloroflexota bacterium]
MSTPSGSTSGQLNPQAEKARQMFLSISVGRRITLVAAVIGLVLSFFSWYSGSSVAGNGGSDSGWHGWGFLAVLLLIVCGVISALPLLGIPSLRGLMPALPSMVTDGLVLSLGGTIAVVATILFMANEYSGISFSSDAGSAGFTIWCYLFLVCAIAACIGGFMVRSESESGSAVSSMSGLVAGLRQAFLGLSLGRRLAVGGAVVAFVFSFLHWYSYSQSAQVSGVAGYGWSSSIIGWHDWAFIGLLFLIIGGLLALAPLIGLPSVRRFVPGLPPTVSDAEVVMGAGVLAVVAILLFIVTEGSSTSGYFSAVYTSGALSKGASYGAYIGLICGVAMAAGGYLMRSEPAA